MTVTSDNYGEPVDHVYTLKCKATPDPIVEKAQPIPCGKIAEGLSTLSQDEIYWKKPGFVKDAQTGALRKMNTEEYDKILKQQQKRTVPVKKNSRINFGRFLKK
jgi:hypothetical protein